MVSSCLITEEETDSFVAINLGSSMPHLRELKTEKEVGLLLGCSRANRESVRRVSSACFCVPYRVSHVDVTVAGAARLSHSGDVTKDSLLERPVGVTEHSVAVM